MTIIQAQPLKQFGISGPTSAINNEIPVFDGTTGKKIKAGSGIINPSSGRLNLSELRAIDGDGLKLYEDGGDGIFIEDGGNVGIGLNNTGTTPQKLLDLSGNINITKVAQPLASFTLTGTTGGSLDDGAVYYYSVAYVTAEGDTAAGDNGSAYFKTIDLASGQTAVDITDIPISTDPRVTGRKLYRTYAGGYCGSQYLVVEFNENTTTSYSDTKADGDLDASDGTRHKENMTVKGIYVDNKLFAFMGSKNQSYGLEALDSLTVGTSNLALGAGSLTALTTGGYNIALGDRASNSLISGGYNIALGDVALYNNQTGSSNIAIGYNSMRSDVTGTNVSNNVGIGSNSLRSLANGNTRNTGLGYYTGYNFQGSYNTFLGSETGRLGSATAIGDYNLFMGYDVGDNATTGAGSNILIGDRIDLPFSNGSNQLSIGNLIFGTGLDGTGTSISTGNIGIGTNSPDTKLQVIGDTKLGDDNTNYASFAADGEITLNGTARVIRNRWLNVAGLKAPGGKPATEVAHGLDGAWQFANQAIEANQENVSGRMLLAPTMDRSVAPTGKIAWSSNGADVGDCKWQVEYVWTAVNEPTNASAQETLTVVSTASSTSNGMTVVEITGIDLPSSTDQCITFKITRLSADAQDTITGTVEVVGVCLSYTSNKLGEST